MCNPQLRQGVRQSPLTSLYMLSESRAKTDRVLPLLISHPSLIPSNRQPRQTQENCNFYAPAIVQPSLVAEDSRALHTNPLAGSRSRDIECLFRLSSGLMTGRGEDSRGRMKLLMLSSGEDNTILHLTGERGSFVQSQGLRAQVGGEEHPFDLVSVINPEWQSA